MVPAVELHAYIKYVQSKIRIQFGLVENIDVKRDLYQSRRPAPDAFFHDQPNAGDAGNDSDSFNKSHGSTMMCYSSRSRGIFLKLK